MSKIEIEKIYSKFLNRDVELSIYLPTNYNEDTEVIYMHDGNNAFFDDKANYGMSWKIDKVIEENNEPKIVVGFESNSCNDGLERLREYSIWDNNGVFERENFAKYFNKYNGVLKAKGNEHIRFLTEELIPHVERKYNLGKNRSVLGSSMGGLMSLTIALKYPSLFNKAYCVSNAFWYALDGIVDLIERSETSEVKIYLDVGTNEDSFGIEDIDKMYIDTNKLVVSKLSDKGFNVVFNIIEGGEHNEINWHKRLDIILRQEKV